MKINPKKLKISMGQNLPLLRDTLSAYGFKSPVIVDDKKIQCGFNNKSSGTAIQIDCSGDFPRYFRWSNRTNGDILALFRLKEDNFGKLLNNLHKIFNGEYGKVIKDIKDSIQSYNVLDQISTKQIDIEYNPNYFNPEMENFIFYQLIKDKISYHSQLKFNIFYDDNSDRIIFTWKDIEGHIVGYTGRYNGEIRWRQKYLPIHGNFRKGNHLYGSFENFIHIYQKKLVYIFEAEKSVLQMDTMGINNVVSIGSSNITVNQLLLLNNIGVKNLVFCFDEGLKDIKLILNRINEICNLNGMSFNLYFILDYDNKYLDKDSKDSPSDNGIEVWNGLKNNRIFKFEKVIGD